MTDKNQTDRTAQKRQLQVQDLPQPAADALTPEQAEEAKGGIIAVLIGAKAKDPTKSEAP